jgi:microcin C transport system permease protein
MTMSPLNRRRWENFRRNRRGWYSLWILLSLFSISLCAELIANDRPLLVSYKHSLYAPVIHDYPESTFGGTLNSQADYRDPYVAGLIQADGWMLWPPVRFNAKTINYNLTVPAPSPPSHENILGTDDQGRDVFARVLYGFRISILFAMALTTGGVIIGVMAGAIQGYYGGWIDIIGQRFVEIWSGLPVLFMLIILSSIVQPNFWWLLGIMLLFQWLALEGLVRAEFLRGRNLEYVRAARALGAGDRRIMFVHMLPNAMIATLTFLPFLFSGSIETLTSLDFLGFGLPPGSPSLGELLAQGKNNLNAPWLGISGFTTIATLLMLLVFIGEAARDALDARRQV